MNALLNMPDRFVVRVLTRSARAWPPGVEVTVGDMHDDGAVERLLQGAWGCFLVTFSDFENDGAEVALGSHIADLAVAAGVRYMVFSSGVRTGVAFMDAKATIEEHVCRLRFPRALYLRSGFFYENLSLKGDEPRIRCEQQPDGTRVVFTSPMPPSIKVAMHAAGDVGLIAARWFADPASEPPGAAIRIVGDYISGDEFAATFTSVARARGVAMEGAYEAMPLDMLAKLVSRCLCVYSL